MLERCPSWKMFWLILLLPSALQAQSADKAASVFEDMAKLSLTQRKEVHDFRTRRVSIFRYLPCRAQLVTNLRATLGKKSTADGELRCMAVDAMGEIGGWEDKDFLLSRVREAEGEELIRTANALALICLVFDWDWNIGTTTVSARQINATRAYWAKWQKRFGRMRFDEYVKSRYGCLATEEEKKQFVSLLAMRPVEQALAGYQVVVSIERDPAILGLMISTSEFLAAQKFDRSVDCGVHAFLEWLKHVRGVNDVLRGWEEYFAVSSPFDREQMRTLTENLMHDRLANRFYSQVLLNAGTDRIDPYGLLIPDQIFVRPSERYWEHQRKVRDYWAGAATGSTPDKAVP